MPIFPVLARWLAPLAMLCALAAHPLAAAAQGGWPERPLRVIVPYSPGGNTDLIARAIMERLAVRLGQPIVVENRPGANSILGTGQVANAPADGYTLLIAIPAYALNRALYKQLPYAADALAPVTQLTRTSLVIVTSAALPLADFPTLLQYGRAGSPPLTFASSGLGSMAHLLGERLAQSTGMAHAMHIPYKGSTDALNDLLSGRIGFMFDAVSAMGPHIQQGKLNAVAVTGETRSPMLPEVPTVIELGHPELESYAWAGLFAPKGTPTAIVQRLADETAQVLRDPELRAKLAGLATEPVGSPPAQFAEFVDNEVALGAATVQRIGLTLQ